MYFDDLVKFKYELAQIGYEDSNATLMHELSHGMCALAVGVSSVRYGFLLGEWGEPESAITTLARPTRLPRIAFAAICVAPVVPSQYDLDDMRKIGYSTVDEVRERISSWNRQYVNFQIPLPGTIEV